MAFQAIVVHHQGSRRDELAVGRDGFGGVKVELTLLRPLDAERARILKVQHSHQHDEAGDGHAEPPGPLPADHRAGQTMFHVQRDRQEQQRHMQPVAHLADSRIANLKALQPYQDQARDQNHQRRGQECQAEPNRRLVRPIPRGRQMGEPEDQERHDQ